MRPPPERLHDYIVTLGLGDEALKQITTSQLDSPNDILYQDYPGEVLCRYPKFDHVDFKLPDLLGMFSFPIDINLKPSRQSTAYHSFVMTENDGNKYFGFCLTKWFRLSSRKMEVINEVLQKSGLAPFAKPLFAPTCVCIVSHWPFHVSFHKFFRAFLDVVPKRSKFGVSVLKKANSILSVPFPTPGGVNVSVGVRNSVFFPYPKSEEELPLADIDYRCLITNLSVENVINVLTFILTERQIVFVSERTGQLTSVLESLISLLYPFEWPHVYIPVLHKSLADFVDAPLPYIIGVHRSFFLTVSVPAQAIVVDLDADTIFVPNSELNSSGQLLDPTVTLLFPDKEQASLAHRLRKYYKGIKRLQRRSPTRSDLWSGTLTALPHCGASNNGGTYNRRSNSESHSSLSSDRLSTNSNTSSDTDSKNGIKLATPEEAKAAAVPYSIYCSSSSSEEDDYYDEQEDEEEEVSGVLSNNNDMLDNLYWNIPPFDEPETMGSKKQHPAVPNDAQLQQQQRQQQHPQPPEQEQQQQQQSQQSLRLSPEALRRRTRPLSAEGQAKGMHRGLARYSREESFTDPMTKSLAVIKSFRTVFVMFFVSMFKAYRQYLIFPTSDNPEPEKLFDSNSFINDMPSRFSRFLRSFTETQIFQYFIQDRITSTADDMFEKHVREKMSRLALKLSILASDTKRGTLFKRGAIRKNWKNRWFELIDLELVYYDFNNSGGGGISSSNCGNGAAGSRCHRQSVGAVKSKAEKGRLSLKPGKSKILILPDSKRLDVSQPTPYMFAIVNEDRTLFCCADTPKIRTEWVRVLQAKTMDPKQRESLVTRFQSKVHFDNRNLHIMLSREEPFLKFMHLARDIYSKHTSGSGACSPMPGSSMGSGGSGGSNSNNNSPFDNNGTLVYRDSPTTMKLGLSISRDGTTPPPHAAAAAAAADLPSSFSSDSLNIFYSSEESESDNNNDYEDRQR